MYTHNQGRNKAKIREFAKLAGVSVRTLHFYDEIGLLKPSSVDKQDGYCFYDEHTLMRMQEIFKEIVKGGEGGKTLKCVFWR